MNARTLKRVINCTVVLLVFSVVLGMAGCSKKTIKTTALDVIAADTEPVAVEAIDSLTNASSSGRAVKVPDTDAEPGGVFDEIGNVGELKIEILDNGSAESSAGGAGQLVEVVVDEFAFGVEASRKAASRAGEDFIAVQPGTAESAQVPSRTTLSFLEAGQPGPRPSGVSDERIVIQGRSSGIAEGDQLGGTLSFLEAGQSGPGPSGVVDERIFIERRSSGDVATQTDGTLAFAVSDGDTSRGYGVDGEVLIIESASDADAYAAGVFGGRSVEGVRQGQSTPITKGSTSTFLIEKRPMGDAAHVLKGDALSSTDDVRASASRGNEKIVVTPRSTDNEESTGRQMHTFTDTRHADSNVEPERVPEPLLFAEIQRNILLPLPAREQKSQALAIVSAPAETLVIKEAFGDIYFDFDRWAIPLMMQARLSDHAQWMKANPEEDVLIEGHCDVRGSREYNVVLGEKRARSVKEFLVDLGVANERISLLSYGKERLTCFENEEACHQDNRRAHLALR